MVDLRGPVLSELEELSLTGFPFLDNFFEALSTQDTDNIAVFGPPCPLLSRMTIIGCSVTEDRVQRFLQSRDTMQNIRLGCVKLESAQLTDEEGRKTTVRLDRSVPLYASAPSQGRMGQGQ